MIGLAGPVLVIAMAGLAFAGSAATWRILTGPSLADRIIGLDLALIALMAGIAIDGAHRKDTTWLNLLVVIAVIGFTATVASTRYMEHTRDDEDRTIS